LTIGKNHESRKKQTGVKHFKILLKTISELQQIFCLIVKLELKIRFKPTNKHAFLPYGICSLKIGNVISFKWVEMGFGVKRIIHFRP